MRYGITQFASTILKCFGVEKESHMANAMDIASEITADGKILDRCLIFSVDAVPEYVVEEFPNYFENIRKHAPYEVAVKTVMPSITPVCYGAMFSGATPDKNGLPEYKEPKIVDGVAQPSLSVIPYTEALVNAGKKVAVITCENGCIASMLYGRKADLYIIPNDDEEKIFETALEVLKQDKYNLIFVYQFEYDHTQHKYSPKGENTLKVLKHTNDKFDIISEVAKKTWAGYKSLIVYNCDHGSHAVGDNLTEGAHGEDISEDMNIRWFLGWQND